jgi:hypothetical protein
MGDWCEETKKQSIQKTSYALIYIYIYTNSSADASQSEERASVGYDPLLAVPSLPLEFLKLLANSFIEPTSP